MTRQEAASTVRSYHIHRDINVKLHYWDLREHLDTMWCHDGIWYGMVWYGMVWGGNGILLSLTSQL